MDKHITAPITKETARSLHAGDYVYVTGTIYTARDAAHKRMDEALDRGESVSYTHLTLPTTRHQCRSRWSPYH